MNRKEYINLVNDWNNFLLKEEKLLHLESYMINEGFGQTLKMFTAGALALIGSKIVDIQPVQAQPPSSSNQQQDNELEDWGTMDNVNLSTQKEKDIDESSRAIITALTIDGHTFDGTKKGSGQKELVKSLKSLGSYTDEEIEEYFQHNSYSVAIADAKKIIKRAIEQAKKDKVEQIDREYLVSITSETSSFEGHEVIEELLDSTKPKIISSYNKTKELIKKNVYKKINNNKEKFEQAKAALESISKGFQNRGVNSNNAKAMVLILMGFDLKTAKLVNTVKSINKKGSVGASLNPKIQRHLNIVGLIVDFSLNESEELKDDTTREIFNSKDGADVYSLLEAIRGSGYKFQLKIKNALTGLTFKSKLNSKGDSAEARGNPQAYIEDID